MADIARHVGVSRPLVSVVVRGADGASEAARGCACSKPSRNSVIDPTLAHGERSRRTRRLGAVFAFRRPFEVEPTGQVWARRDFAR